MIKVALKGLASNIHTNLYIDLIKKYSTKFSAKEVEFNKYNSRSKLYGYKIFHGITLSRSYKIFISAKFRGLRTINHWMGSDVEFALNSWIAYLKVKVTSLFIDKHLACSEHLVKELSSLGIKAAYMPVVNTGSLSKQIKPLSKEFSVLAYLPDNRHEFYGSKYIYKLACEFEKINFYVVAGEGGQYPKRKNLIYLGYQQDMDKIYEEIHVLIRMVKHDGFSLCVQEALSYGRNVIYSYKQEFCFYAENYNEIKNHLNSLINEPRINYKGNQFMKENYSPEKIYNKLEKIYSNLL